MTETPVKTLALINPQSANGRTGRRWPGLADLLGQAIGPFDEAFTRRPQEATALARQALAAGYRRLVIVGGDGTLNEAVNGLLDDGRGIVSEVAVAIMPQGTGGDFRRTLGIPRDPTAAAQVIRRGHVRPIDIGKATFIGPDGEPASRYFVNVASFGMSGAVAEAVNDAGWMKRLGGTASFYLSTVATMVRHRNAEVTLTIDGGAPGRWRANTVAICNGTSFGGGMTVAPMADPGDGTLDVIVLGDFGLSDFLIHGARLYQGRHLELDKVVALPGHHVEAESRAALPLELDGEPVGSLAAAFDVVPAAINVIA